MLPLKYNYWKICILYLNISYVSSFTPSDAIESVWRSTGRFLYDYTVCNFKECCTEREIPANFNKLEYLLKQKVYGQHIAVKTILSSLRAHWNKRGPKPSKPLTLSFHGWPGSGKNYITNFIKESLYARGGQSKHVHHFVGRIDFPRNQDYLVYQSQLQDWIKGNVSNCPRQLFIFDEVDKIPIKVLDILKPFIDYNKYLHRVDYRESIFIFLSNTGESDIIQQTLYFWKGGYKREDIALEQFESLISKGAFNEEGGFHFSDTIKSNLIDHYVPFLPLEQEHVKLCILDEFRERGIPLVHDEDIHSILEILQWGPAGERVFSSTGCKRVSQKVALVASKYLNENPHIVDDDSEL